MQNAGRCKYAATCFRRIADQSFVPGRCHLATNVHRCAIRHQLRTVNHPTDLKSFMAGPLSRGKSNLAIDVHRDAVGHQLHAVDHLAEAVVRAGDSRAAVGRQPLLQRLHHLRACWESLMMRQMHPLLCVLCVSLCRNCAAACRDAALTVGALLVLLARPTACSNLCWGTCVDATTRRRVPPLVSQPGMRIQ